MRKTELTLKEFASVSMTTRVLFITCELFQSFNELKLRPHPGCYPGLALANAFGVMPTLPATNALHLLTQLH